MEVPLVKRGNENFITESDQTSSCCHVESIKSLIMCCADATVGAHSCVDIVAKFTDEQYTTINQSTAGCFDLRVLTSCS